MIFNNTQVSIVAGEVLTVMEQDGGFSTKRDLKESLNEHSFMIDMGVGCLVKSGLVLVQPLFEEDYLVVKAK